MTDVRHFATRSARQQTGSTQSQSKQYAHETFETPRPAVRRVHGSDYELASATTDADTITDTAGKQWNFYDFYLKDKPRCTPLQPCLWISKLDAESKLPTELQNDPLQVLDQPEASLELVQSCLEAFVARTRRDYNTKAAAREQYITNNVGVSLMS